MKLFSYTTENLTHFTNKCIEDFTQKMYDSGEIDSTSKDNMDRYSVVIVEKNIFGRAWDNLFKEVKEMHVVMVKMVKT